MTDGGQILRCSARRKTRHHENPASPPFPRIRIATSDADRDRHDESNKPVMRSPQRGSPEAAFGSTRRAAGPGRSTGIAAISWTYHSSKLSRSGLTAAPPEMAIFLSLVLGLARRSTVQLLDRILIENECHQDSELATQTASRPARRATSREAEP
jgi:hypothetical protein